MSDIEVIKYLRKKDTSTEENFQSPIHFGTKPCFVSAIRNSNLNNLEEQLIFGTDDYIVTWEDNEGNTVIDQSFRTNNKLIDYYNMRSIIYKDEKMYGDVSFDQTNLDISNKLNVQFGWDPSISIPDPDPNTIYFPSDRFSIPQDPGIEPDLFIGDPLGGYSKVRDDELWWIKSDNKSIKVLTKSTGVKHLGNSTITYSRVENLLDKTEETPEP